MNSNCLFYAVTHSAADTLPPTIFADPPYCLHVPILSQFIVIFKLLEKTSMFTFLLLEPRFGSLPELHVHSKSFMYIRMRKLHAECQIPVDLWDRCQIGF